MNFAIIIYRFRWLQLPTSLLAMLLQRTPVLRVLTAEGPGFAIRSADILKSTFALAALGAYNSVTGATTFNATIVAPTTVSPGSVGARSTFTVASPSGSSFSIGVSGSGAPITIKSWKVSGTLPSGLSVANSTAVTGGFVFNGLKVTISGTPSAAASTNLTLTAYDQLNASGNNTSVTCAVTITGPTAVAPAFTGQPLSRTVNVGDNVTFTATVTGTPTPTLQWFKGVSALSGKTAATLTLSNVQLSDSGEYKLVATNSASPSGTSSNLVTLTVNEPAPVAPVFTVQPVSRTVVAGTSVIFTATVTGTPAPTLQWYKDGEALAGKTASTLTLGSVQAAAAGVYTVVATSSAAPSGVFSDPANLVVNFAPSFSVMPQTQTVALGSSVTLVAEASGNPAPTYAWTKNGVTLANQTGPTLTLGPIAFADAGSYVVTATNPIASAPANAAILSVIIPAPAAIVSAGPLHTGSSVNWDLSGGQPLPAGLLYEATGLPAGLTLDAATGHITGVITANPGSFKVTTSARTGTVKSTLNTTTLVVTAFPSELAGAYETLLYANDVAALPIGKVSLTVTTKGTFSGQLLAADPAPLTLSGRIALAADNASGSAALTLSRGKTRPAYRLDVTVSNIAPAFSARLLASEAVLGLSSDGVRLATAAPVGAAGSYTLLLAAPTNLGTVTDIPLGDGFATATISAKGVLSLAGKNADGTKLTGSFTLSSNNVFRIYAKPYGQVGGYVSGTLPLTPRADNAASWHVAPGSGSDLYWFKPDPVAATTNYADGFGPLGLDARLEPWTKLAATNTLPTLLGLGASGNLTVTIAATGLANDQADPYGLPIFLTLTSANILTVAGNNTVALFSAKVNASTGALTGGFNLKAVPPFAKRAVTYSGVMLQTAPADQPGLSGGGFFILPATVSGGPVVSGKVELATPSPAP